MENALIEFKDVTKRFGSRIILNSVNLKVYEGQVTTIIGKSGSGKSVLLKHIIGLLLPDKGHILLRGKPIDKMSKAEWNEYIRQISYMFQNNALFDSLTVFENIALPLRQTSNLSESEIKHKVMTRIEQTELTQVAYKYPSMLSGGMQKRVALSRTLVTDPKIVLFDEPTTGQDMIRRNAILGMIAEYQKKFGFTAILVSHDLPDIFFISNRIIVLHGAKIIFEGTPEELEDFEHPFVDEFVESIEGFEEHLTGLHSKRNFKVRYQRVLSRKHPQDTFVVAVISLNALDLIGGNLGHERAQEMIKDLGTYIDKHFVSVGGFSTRQGRGLFVTLLPFSDFKESQQLLDEFVSDLHEHGLCGVCADFTNPDESCSDICISAGLAEGKSDQGIESVVKLADSKRKPVACFRYDIPSKNITSMSCLAPANHGVIGAHR